MAVARAAWLVLWGSLAYFAVLPANRAPGGPHDMIAGMAAGDFYIICPDNDVTRDIDNRRILWAAEDIIRNRPALSRWHPDYKDEFATFLASEAPFRR